MSGAKDLDAERDWMMKRWHEYGQEFGVFVPEQQPAPQEWEPELSPPDEKGHFVRTKDFLLSRTNVTGGYSSP